MTLPASGPITMSQIAAEFGGAAPHSLNEYYRGGAWVPDISGNNSIPTSGQISLSNFYGTHGGVLLNSAYSLSDNDSNGSYNTLGFRVTSSGLIQVRTGDDGGFGGSSTWLAGSSPASSFEVMFSTPSSSDHPGIAWAGTFGTWMNLGTTREITFTFSNSPALPSFGEAGVISGVSIRNTGGVTLRGASIGVSWNRTT